MHAAAAFQEKRKPCLKAASQCCHAPIFGLRVVYEQENEPKPPPVGKEQESGEDTSFEQDGGGESSLRPEQERNERGNEKEKGRRNGKERGNEKERKERGNEKERGSEKERVNVKEKGSEKERGSEKKKGNEKERSENKRNTTKSADVKEGEKAGGSRR